ncbi:MAG TPA: hypothetical protein VFU49_10850 [Ktedonobacteraceae bacterium]|nr:hypothetical protein [Ktedonobacteraceae bacterium]
MQQELTNVIETTVDETSFTDEFTFDLEELDGDRAMMFVISPLDPPTCHC